MTEREKAFFLNGMVYASHAKDRADYRQQEALFASVSGITPMMPVVWETAAEVMELLLSGTGDETRMIREKVIREVNEMKESLVKEG